MMIELLANQLDRPTPSGDGHPQAIDQDLCEHDWYVWRKQGRHGCDRFPIEQCTRCGWYRYSCGSCAGKAWTREHDNWEPCQACDRRGSHLIISPTVNPHKGYRRPLS